MKKIFILSFLLFVLFFSSYVSAQSKPQVTITVISASSHSMGPESRDPDIRTENELREPTASDVIDAMKKKKQVTVVIWQSNATSRWAHAVRVRAINITSRNETDANNQTTYFYDARIYDPTSNSTYNRSFAYVVYNDSTNSSLYLDWNGWSVVRDVVTVAKNSPPKYGTTLLHKPLAGQFEFLPLIRVRDIFLSNFH